MRSYQIYLHVFIFIEKIKIYLKNIFVDSIDYEIWIMRSLLGQLILLFTIAMMAVGVQKKRKRRGKLPINKRAIQVAEEFMTTRL